MKLSGSCHCRRVRFSVESQEPTPFMRCYCSICRKTAGSGGFAINLGADHRTLEVEGRDEIEVYRAIMEDGKQSSGRRHFCRHCGTALWLWDENWPDLMHPHAGAIDTVLPDPPEHVHMMLGSKPGWVEVNAGPGDRCFDGYPEESLAQWHERQVRQRG